MASLTDELTTRGLIDGVGGGTLTEVLSKKRNVYLGMDPTADSLHVGHLVPILLMHHLAQAGHKPYFIVGGGTGLIGDPRASGERPLITTQEVNKNVKGLTKQLSRLFGEKSFVMINNATWLTKLRAIDFLRDIGKHFTVNQLIKRDLIKRRLDDEQDSISYTEFSYSLLQAYDYEVLADTHNVDLQIGGADQWTNILSGVDLVRKRLSKTVYALTTPIIVDKSTGKKFGKSEGNAVWLDATKTSPFAFYQFWFNVADENLEEYLKIFTFLPLKKIERVVATHTDAPHKRLGQRTLASEVTAFIHGKEAVESVERVMAILYHGESLANISAKDKALLVKEAPSFVVQKKDVAKGIAIVDALVMSTLSESKGEARRLLSQKAVSVNGREVTAVDEVLQSDDMVNGITLLRRGKKVAVLVLA